MSLSTITSPLLASLALLLASLSAAQAIRPPAPAEPPDTLQFEVPKGYSPLPGLSKQIATTAKTTRYFGDEATKSGAVAYGRANSGALYLTWVESLRPLPNAAQVIRHAFDTTRHGPFMANVESASAQEVSYRESIRDHRAEMNFEWAHLENETVTYIRSIAWLDEDARAHLIVAECVVPQANPGGAADRCTESIDALTFTRAAAPGLASLPDPNPIPRPAPAEMEIPELRTGSSASVEDLPPGPQIGVPPTVPGKVLYQGERQQDPSPDRNRFLIGAGALLLAAAFWLTTRSRRIDDRDETSGDETSGDETSGDETSSGEADNSSSKRTE